MYGYLKSRPTKRDVFAEKQHQSASKLALDTHSAGYLSWEGISYFFGRFWTNGLYESYPSSLPAHRKLVETQVDSDLIQEQKRKDLLGFLGVMEDTMEYTVTAFDTLPKIALKFDATPSQLSRLNKLAIRTLYPGQVLRVPCRKPADPRSECCQPTLQTDAPESMTMDHGARHGPSHIPLAKRVSFDDIDEDVLETFIKVKSKYITDGQGVVKGFLLITPHAIIFHPDVSEVLVVDRGIEYYKVHFTMESVSCAGMFDDIASMVVHDPLHPGHFFLDSQLRTWLGEPGTKGLERIKEEDSTTTLQFSNDSSLAQEPSMESLKSLSKTTKITMNDQPRLETVASTTDASLTDFCSGDLEPTATQQTSADETSLNMNIPSRGVLTDGQIVEKADKLVERIVVQHDLKHETGAFNSEFDSNMKIDSIEQVSGKLRDELSKHSSFDAEISNIETFEMRAQQPNPENCGSETETLRNDDAILSSSEDRGVTNGRLGLNEACEQLPNEQPLQMFSTPKSKPYQDVIGDEHAIDTDVSEGYREGISRDSGIHESKEDVDGDGDDQRWVEIEQNDVAPCEKDVIPRPSAHYEDLPKYMCVKIKRSCWHRHRPTCCRFAHKAIQVATDERREFWFSVPSDRLLEVYGFFLEWCPAIHDGDTDDDEKSDEEFCGSTKSDYSVITLPKDEEEGFELVDNFFSSSPGKENVQNNRLGRKRAHSRGKKPKKRPETKDRERKYSSWSMCSIEEPIMPEVMGKSEILTDPQILQISQCLPSCTIGHTWRLIYSTYLHGISLKTLYRTMADYDTPSLLVILDDSHQVFGAFASSPFAVSDHFYGTGECLLYTFHQHFKVFRWTGENNFFIKGDLDSLALGGGQGNFGLWLDEDLYHGSSHCCKTFNNERLTVKEDFLCSGIEIWCFE